MRVSFPAPRIGLKLDRRGGERISSELRVLRLCGSPAGLSRAGFLLFERRYITPPVVPGQCRDSRQAPGLALGTLESGRDRQSLVGAQRCPAMSRFLKLVEAAGAPIGRPVSPTLERLLPISETELVPISAARRSYWDLDRGDGSSLFRSLLARVLRALSSCKDSPLRTSCARADVIDRGARGSPPASNFGGKRTGGTGISVGRNEGYAGPDQYS